MQDLSHWLLGWIEKIDLSSGQRKTGEKNQKHVIGFQSKVVAPLKIQDRVLTDVEKVTTVFQPQQKRTTIQSNTYNSKSNPKQTADKLEQQALN